MPVKGWKAIESQEPDWDISDDDLENLFDNEIFKIEESERPTMKNVFVDSKKIKKQKISFEIAKEIKFGDVTNIVDSTDGMEAYLGAYSETEFFAYRFQKINKFPPDVFSLRYVKPEKFIEDIFKYCDVPRNAYYKSYMDERGKVKFNSALFAFETNVNGNLYLFLDSDEAFFFYNSELEKDENSIFHLLISILKSYVEPKQQKNKIYVVYQTQSGFEKTGFDVKKVKVDIKQNYNDDFPDVSDEIIKGLNDKDKTNLVILSGVPGSGKTTYIRYLTSKIKKNIIFISPDMVNQITDPAFIPFLIKNNDAVLIIEDAEAAIESRGGGRSGAVSNVLNLTDGLLSDCLNISIVATVNTGSKNIDGALLRKGRLLKNYKFEKLSIEKSKALLEKLGRTDVNVKEPMTLAEIYYYEDDNNSEEFKPHKLGF